MPVDVFEEPADRVDVVAARPSGLGRWVANAASHDSITARVSAAAGVSGPAVRPRWRASEQQPARSIAAVAGTMPRPSRQRQQKENQPHPPRNVPSKLPGSQQIVLAGRPLGRRPTASRPEGLDLAVR
jgi:hypothetical protein